MGGFETEVYVEGCKPRVEDRAEVFQTGSGVVLLVADGSGGREGAEEAAEMTIRMAGEAVQRGGGFSNPFYWRRLLLQIDRAIYDEPTAGEATAVIVSVQPSGISGASVGDAGAWHLTKSGLEDLTRRQQRKPVLGSGEAHPVPFAAYALKGTLLMASDGLLKFASRETLTRIATESDIAGATQNLVDFVRQPSGGLCDDISVILCRQTASSPSFPALASAPRTALYRFFSVLRG